MKEHPITELMLLLCIIIMITDRISGSPYNAEER